MRKATGRSGNWAIDDIKRKTYNPMKNRLETDSNSGEATSGWDVDILPNGFKIRDDSGEVNSNTHTYIYAAFAETPFKYATAR